MQFLAVKEALEAEREKFNLEIERFQQMSYTEQTAHIPYQEITENILNLRCPRCRLVFAEFDGCFALTCKCRAGICAWCLADCGADAHGHVARCPENRTGSVYGTPQDFNRHHRDRRKRLVEEKLKSSNVPAAVMNILRTKLAQDLRHLDIRIDLPGW